MNSHTHLIGVISDTHGKLPEAAVAALQGVELIIHAGDFDHPEILTHIKNIAPLHAVRGNMDRGPWANRLPPSAVVQVGEANLYVLHNLEYLDLSPKAAGMHAVIYGHYHIPEATDRNGVLFLNPGSVSYPRGGSPASLALLRITGTQLVAEHINL